MRSLEQDQAEFPNEARQRAAMRELLQSIVKAGHIISLSHDSARQCLVILFSRITSNSVQVVANDHQQKYFTTIAINEGAFERLARFKLAVFVESLKRKIQTKSVDCSAALPHIDQWRIHLEEIFSKNNLDGARLLFSAIEDRQVNQFGAVVSITELRIEPEMWKVLPLHQAA